jgi:hypothetical protein
LHCRPKQQVQVQDVGALSAMELLDLQQGFQQRQRLQPGVDGRCGVDIVRTV